MRWSKLFQVPMLDQSPAGFPPLTLLTMRALCAVTALKDHETLVKCLDELYPAYWVEGKKTNEKDVLFECLSKVLGQATASNGMHITILRQKEESLTVKQ